MTSLTSSTQKEQFSLSFCHAVATVAGYSMEEIRVDIDSVDFTILSSDTDGLLKKPRLDVQLKCTARPALLN